MDVSVGNCGGAPPCMPPLLAPLRATREPPYPSALREKGPHDGGHDPSRHATIKLGEVELEQFNSWRQKIQCRRPTPPTSLTGRNLVNTSCRCSGRGSRPPKCPTAAGSHLGTSPVAVTAGGRPLNQGGIRPRFAPQMGSRDRQWTDLAISNGEGGRDWSAPKQKVGSGERWGYFYCSVWTTSKNMSQDGQRCSSKSGTG
jgi:hypothetical protein